ncbi:UNVERIFIED_CONTAM: hypothetical protein FKN15_012943 [Acipenser sinensis]
MDPALRGLQMATWTVACRWHSPEVCVQVTPGNAEPATPGDGKQATPGKIEPASPADGEQVTPGEAEQVTPGKAEPAIPGEAELATPADGEQVTPGKAEPAIPGEAELATPADGEQVTPGKAEPAIPGEAELATPADGEQVTATNVDEGCVTHFTGTSSAAPMASGILALVLEANLRLDNMENYWASVKKQFKTMPGTAEEMIPLYPDTFIWRESILVCNPFPNNERLCNPGSLKEKMTAKPYFWDMPACLVFAEHFISKLPIGPSME